MGVYLKLSNTPLPHTPKLMYDHALSFVIFIQDHSRVKIMNIPIKRIPKLIIFEHFLDGTSELNEFESNFSVEADLKIANADNLTRSGGYFVS